MEYIKETIYIIEYEGNEKAVSVSYGIIKGIDIKNKYTFEHISCTEKGSSGSPILNMKTNKVIYKHITIIFIINLLLLIKFFLIFI